MEIEDVHIQKLKDLMINSARKGNLANSACVFENDRPIEFSESLVASNKNTTAHSERILVEKVCKRKGSCYTPGLKMLTIVEPCLMCMSACSQAGYSEIFYIIPAKKYFDKISFMTDTSSVINKEEIAKNFVNPIKLTHLYKYEEKFSKIFEKEMEKLLSN